MSSPANGAKSSVEHEGVVPLARKAPTHTAFPGWADELPRVEAPPPAPPEPPRAKADTAFVGTLAAIAAVLASRLLLLLAVVGTFVLALQARDNFGLYTAVAFAILVVLPLVWLDISTRRNR